MWPRLFLRTYTILLPHKMVCRMEVCGMEKGESHESCKIIFSETGPLFEEVLLWLLREEMEKEETVWQLPK